MTRDSERFIVVRRPPEAGGTWCLLDTGGGPYQLVGGQDYRCWVMAEYTAPEPAMRFARTLNSRPGVVSGG